MNNQKGFVSIVLVLFVVVLVGTAGYFILTKKSEPATTNSPLVTPSPASSGLNPSTTSTGTPKVEAPKKPVEKKSEYPFSKYLPLSSAKLEDLRKIFIERNGNAWTAELDEFGFVRDIKTSDPTFVSQDDTTKYNFTDLEKSRWEQFILKNKDFFGIDDSKNFQLEYQTFYGTTNTGEKVITDKRLKVVQKFNSNSFSGSDNGALLSEYEKPIGVFKLVRTIPKFEITISIQSHFWPKAVVPLTPSILKNDIEKKFIGSDYTYQEITPGYPCDPLPDGTGCRGAHEPSAVSHTVKIQKGDLDFNLIPHLFKHDSVLELRLVYLTKLRLPDGWTKFFDAITGAELKSGS